MSNGSGTPQSWPNGHGNVLAFAHNSSAAIDPSIQLPPTYLDYRNAPIDSPRPRTAPREPAEQLLEKSTLHDDQERRDSAQPSAPAVAADPPLQHAIRPVTPKDGSLSLSRLDAGESPSRSPNGTVRTSVSQKGKIGRSIIVGAGFSAAVPISSDHTFQYIHPAMPAKDLEDPFTSDNVQDSSTGKVLMAAPQDSKLDQASDIQEYEKANGHVYHTPTKGAGTPRLESAQSFYRPDPSVLAAGGRSSSMRVRSMYDMGGVLSQTERPASALSRISRITDIALEGCGEAPQGSLTPKPSRMTNGSIKSPRSTSALSNRSVILKEPGEAAGGAEDWTDVASSDVDRYGFIRPRSLRSKHSSMLSMVPPGTPDVTGRQRQYAHLPAISETAPQASQSLGRSESRLSQQLSSIVNRNSRFAFASTSSSNRSQRSKISAFDFLRSSRTRQRHLIAEARKIIPTPAGPLASDASLELLDSSLPARIKLETKRAAKWTQMARPKASPPITTTSLGGGTTFSFSTTDTKLISRTWKGIPDRWRASAWHAFLTASASRHSPTGRPTPSDLDLISRFHAFQEVDCSDDDQIDIDIPRTIGQHVLFRKRYRGGQRFLFRVLHALALYFPDLGYVQGMAALVATLVCYFDEELAFVVAVRMWKHRGVGWLYKEGFDCLMAALADFETDWIGLGDDGGLRKHLDALGVGPSVWGTKWYLTLFNYTLPFQAQLRVWDVLMLLGDAPIIPSAGASGAGVVPEMRETAAVSPSSDFEKPNLDVVHAVAAALLLGLREQLMVADFEHAMERLTAPVLVQGEAAEDALLRVARGVMAECARGRRRKGRE